MSLAIDVEPRVKLSHSDWKHIHKVLSSDIDECSILSGDDKVGDRAFKNRMRRRQNKDRRIRELIEGILGYKPKWEYKQKEKPNG